MEVSLLDFVLLSYFQIFLCLIGGGWWWVSVCLFVRSFEKGSHHVAPTSLKLLNFGKGRLGGKTILESPPSLIHLPGT